jgi:nitroreductase
MGEGKLALIRADTEEVTMESDAKLFETLFSTRAMRRLKPDPVPEPLIEQILRAGQAAPNAGNAQDFGVLVVTDPAVKAKVQVYYQRVYGESVGPNYAKRLAQMPDGPERDRLARQVAATEHLTRHFHAAPVWLVACLKVGARGADAMSGASIYPAVQNMLLAARALGLGATLTTRHMVYGAEVDALLGLLEGVKSFAILPIGYPEGRFGPVSRGPLEAFAHRETWGRPFEAAPKRPLS